MKKSAGILVYRKRKDYEIFLVHPGGPYWQNKEENCWSIPKGEIDVKEAVSASEPNRKHIRNSSQEGSHKFASLKQTAIREFEEETGLKLTNEDIKKISYLGEVKKQNKIVYVFILEKDFGDDFEVKSNLIEIEWPPKSGKIIKIPEIDKAGYFDLETARKKLVNYQKPLVDKLIDKLMIK